MYNNKHNIDKVLQAYVKMILDNTAFSKWEHKPDYNTRCEIVNVLLERKCNLEDFNFFIGKDEEINKLLESWKIKDDEFKI